MNVSLPFRASAAVLAAGLIALSGPATATGTSELTPTSGGTRCTTPATASTWSAPTQRDLLLAAAALIVGIALRRARF